MKKILFGSLLLSLLVLSGCGQKPIINIPSVEPIPSVSDQPVATSTSNEPVPLDLVSPDGSILATTTTTDTCQSNGGTWLNEYRECENIGSDWCLRHSGVFNECGSACRHQPQATVCTLQCVPFCSLAEVKSEPQTLVNVGDVNPEGKCAPCPTYAAPKPGWCRDGIIVQPEKDSCGCVGRPVCRTK